MVKSFMKVLFDWFALAIGILSLIFNLAQFNCSKLSDILCITAGLCCLIYIGICIRYILNRPKFDWHLINGRFLRKVVAFVILVPSMITSGFLLYSCRMESEYSPKNLVYGYDLYTHDDEVIDTLGKTKNELLLDSVFCKIHDLEIIDGSVITHKTKTTDSDSINYKQEDPSVFWTVYYHYIDPGNQHMTLSKNGRNWSALIAILGVFLLNGLLVSSLVGWIDNRKEKWYNGEIRYRYFALRNKKYAVVIGVSDIASTIITNLMRGKGESVVDYVILLTNENAQEVRERISSYLDKDDIEKLIVYQGQLDSIREIYDLRLKHATEIYVLGGETEEDGEVQSFHDAQNMKIVHNIASYLTDKCVERKIVCRVQFEYQTTYSVFQFSDLPTKIKDHLFFMPFNTYENWAQRVFTYCEYEERVRKVLPMQRKSDLEPTWFNNKMHAVINWIQGELSKRNNEIRRIEYLPLDGKGITIDSDKYVHLIVVGMTKMGIAVAIQAAQVAHYPNFSRNKSYRTTITFIDENADEEMNFFKSRYHNLFELSRSRFIDGTSDNTDFSKIEWETPIKEKDFIDVQWEFIKGSVDMPAVKKYLESPAEALPPENPEGSEKSDETVALSENPEGSENPAETTASPKKTEREILTLAICIPQTHKAIAAALYLPDAIYDSAKQILVYQKESSDIICNLYDEDSCQHKRYAKLRPFGMRYIDFTNDKDNTYKAILCNYVYDLISDPHVSNDVICNVIKDGDGKKYSMEDALKKWNNLSVANRWSNRYLANGFETKLRSIGSPYKNISLNYAEMKKMIKENEDVLAECEHNRWNIQQLLMGYRALTPAEREEYRNIKSDSEIPDNLIKTKKSDFKKKKRDGLERAHLDICTYKDLKEDDKGAMEYDYILNNAIPDIMMRTNKLLENS